MKMQITEFSQGLRRWRGKKFQKQAAEVIGVPIRTYQSWENGVRAPAKICKECVEKRMAAGFPIEPEKV